jgi:hypothetical protein
LQFRGLLPPTSLIAARPVEHAWAATPPKSGLSPTKFRSPEFSALSVAEHHRQFVSKLSQTNYVITQSVSLLQSSFVYRSEALRNANSILSSIRRYLHRSSRIRRLFSSTPLRAPTASIRALRRHQLHFYVVTDYTFTLSPTTPLRRCRLSFQPSEAIYTLIFRAIFIFYYRNLTVFRGISILL